MVASMAKAFSPPAHAVDRPALRHRLDEALEQSLALVVAPAGAGKSVLLAQWAATHPELAFVWLDVDPADDDPVRFSQQLLRGLAGIDPDFADLASLASMHGGGLGMPLLEALAAQMVELPEVVIVLDDLHHLSNAALVADLGRLVELIPPNVHLVLSTRIDLPIAWSRHRVRREMTEIRQSDLALDDVDSAFLIERMAGHSLGSDSVSALVDRTEGWATGLQLAGMMLRLHRDPDAFITQLSGNDRLIADYLSEEVLDAQPDSRRRFLLRISVLDEMSAELVGRLTDVPDAQQELEELERRSMFLVPLDDRREWFRFHHLFRDLLRFRLRAEDPLAEAQLLGRAAHWHLERGDVNAAVDYLLAAKDWDGALDVILGRGSEVFERGEMATVIRWINEVPEAARSGRRDVALLLGALKLAEGQVVEAEDTLRRVTGDPDASPGEQLAAQALLAAMAQWRPRPYVSIDVATRALDMLARIGHHPVPVVMNLTDPQSLEAMATVSCGRAHFLAGNMDEARYWLERGLASPGAAYSIWRVSGLGSLSLLEAWRGRTERAEELAAEALAIAGAVGRLSHPSTADAYLAITLAALERGQPRSAALSLHEGSLRAEANRRAQLSWIAHLETALHHAADGLPDLAMTTLLSNRNELGAPPPVAADRLLALRGRLLRLGGSPDQSLRVLGDGVSRSTELTFERAAASIALGHVDLARKLIDGTPAPFDTTDPLVVVERLILQAWMAHADGFVDEARTRLAEATDVAERHCLVEVFVRAGPTVIQLVSELSEGPSEFRRIVLDRAREVLTPSPGAELVDPLTDRELEILSYLPSRYTNTELAERCYVSVNTIKTHMAHIYRKLDVPNRNGAIVRAREIGLL